jgi:hypothetical protein
MPEGAAKGERVTVLERAMKDQRAMAHDRDSQSEASRGFGEAHAIETGQVSDRTNRTERPTP